MKSIKILFDDYEVTGLLNRNQDSVAVLILGHGAGAGMTHSFMEQLSEDLLDEGIATLRYNFPYMEAGRRSPNSPKISMATVRAAVNKAHEIAPDLPLLAGGKSYGGRMSSQAQAQEPLPHVKGLVFYGFPLHAPGRPGDQRGEHLFEIDAPMLFIQGTRDKLAELNLLKPLLNKIGKPARLEIIDGADHGFSVLKRHDLTTAEVRKNLAKLTRRWWDSL
jgi:predicted alpha/beta-hydrolase family hydrolase